MSFDNFIMEVPGAFSKSWCNSVIEQFEKDKNLQLDGTCGSNINGSSTVDKKIKDGTEICVNPKLLGNPEWRPLLEPFQKILKKHIKNYCKRYSFVDESNDTESGLNGIAKLELEPEFNIQKFYPEKGFFVWHVETGSDTNSYRQLVWMIYLNDLKDKGGTLFKFQDIRCKPQKGKLVIWPAGWTHFHKSEISPSEIKYIATGWYKYA
jgi:hypothetical protein